MSTDPRPAIHDSPWFWVALFSACGLILTLVISSKYSNRQTRLRHRYEAYQRMQEDRLRQQSGTEENAGGDPTAAHDNELENDDGFRRVDKIPKDADDLPGTSPLQPLPQGTNAVPIMITIGIVFVVSLVGLTRHWQRSCSSCSTDATPHSPSGVKHDL